MTAIRRKFLNLTIALIDTGPTRLVCSFTLALTQASYVRSQA